jgi:LAO/AO transport system kinase
MAAYDLATRVAGGDVRALARAIRMLEDGDPAIETVDRELRPRVGSARLVGVTGPPGSGKSTLSDQLIARWRRDGHRVGVIAVDPSSPFSGGAILGDRVRMQRHATDAGVFIRSMAARGHLGGLASAAREAVRLPDASGRDRNLIETVGFGQSELEVMQLADTVIVVTTPASGDSVQISKAGILEIADILVVNKADLPGAPKVYRELRDLVRQTKAHAAWVPPVIQVSAQEGTGVDELVGEIDRHSESTSDSGELERRRRDRVRAEVEAIVVERAARRARAAFDDASMRAALDGDPAQLDPYELAELILSRDGAAND